MKSKRIEFLFLPMKRVIARHSVVKPSLRLFAMSVVLCSGVAFGQGVQMTDEESKVLDRHKDEMSDRVRIASDDAFTAYCINYHVPRFRNRQFYSLVCRREARKAAYDYIYPESAAKRVRAKMAIDSLFEDSLNAILIPYNNISGENLSYAIRIAKVNDVDSAQYEYLMAKALELARKLKKNPRLNVWNDDINTVRQTLSEKQLRRFLSLKNGMKVTQKMRTAWQKLADAGLTAELDSARDCAQAYMYYFEEQRINDLYRYYGTSKKKYMAELVKKMPRMVKMYDALGKKARVLARKKKATTDKTIGKEFAW